MKKYALIGAIIFLIVPFSYIHIVGNSFEQTTFIGYVYTSSEGKFLFFEDSGTETFSFSWLEDDGYYNRVFGNMWILGVLSLLILIASVVFAILDDKKKPRSALLLIAAGIINIFLRLSVLGDDDLSFYSERSNLFGEYTYLEIPYGAIIAIIFAIFELKEK